MSKRVITSKDLADVQQPLDKDGYSNDYFDKLYGKDKNPHTGGERDRKNKKNIYVSSPGDAYRKGWERIFGK